jgi:hypothetical protein
MTAMLTTPRLSLDWLPDHESALVSLIGEQGALVRVSIVGPDNPDGLILEERERGDNTDVCGIADDILAGAGWRRTEDWTSAGGGSGFTDFDALLGNAPYDSACADVEHAPGNETDNPLCRKAARPVWRV